MSRSRLLEVDGLTVGAGDRPLVRGVGFTVDRGERVGIIGESGSGKTLTALALLGLLGEGLRAEGSARLDGVPFDLLGATDRELSTVRGRLAGMVFQEPMTALNPVMKVGPQVAEALRLHGPRSERPGRAEARAAAVGLLDRLRLPDPARAARSYPHQLSGGQRQRAVLGGALATDPALLICDEPTTALDVTVQKEIVDLVTGVSDERGTAVLYISHDLALVASVCHRVLVMYDGEIVESGPVEQVLRRPQHPYTRALLKASDLTVPAPRPPAPAEPRTLLKARGLTRRYARPRRGLFAPRTYFTALEGLDLDLRAGGRTGVVGESGSGKTTLLRLLSGLDRPTSGTVDDVAGRDVAGRDVAGRSEDHTHGRSHGLQVVFQDPMGSLDPRMRVRDIIAEPLPDRRSPAATARVAELLADVGLPAEAASRYPHQFSGGQRQRIAIARALAPRPSVLLADEPVSALDVSVRAQVLDVLSKVTAERDMALCIVTHDLGVVRYLCDEVVVMKEGRVVERGPVERVWEAPEHPYTRQLLEAVPVLH
ncbi:ABC transporter ATP-binding protein [Streptomyces rectiverticillatus]|uniref:dipeptide ABC transporter ATP-binding protein n=1 Tax=Streptomyces rectiverticillatus TaxID=173860 RepID=UPI0015C3951A|nr:ABC transporter ATP-binding protein [Streptomyces rectiverticillatus]QLE73244.1 ABC transporter ATP-binding protein [Streptomyces rectiverticillatus]